MLETAPSDGIQQRIAQLERHQPVLAHLGIAVSHVAAGEVDLSLQPHGAVTQQNGFVHAGVVATMADTAAGFAAYTLFAPGEDILTIEFKLNLLRPATGVRVVARGRVLKPGRTITVAESEVWACGERGERLAAKATVSLIRVPPSGS